MSKHTSGPWRIERLSARSQHWSIYTPGNACVAETQTEANARLIAAAPDMKALLDEIVTSDPRCHIEQWQARIRAVIASAEVRS